MRISHSVPWYRVYLTCWVTAACKILVYTWDRGGWDVVGFGLASLEGSAAPMSSWPDKCVSPRANNPGPDVGGLALFGLGTTSRPLPRHAGHLLYNA